MIGKYTKIPTKKHRGQGGLRPVPVGNSRSDILMVQPAQYWHGQRLTEGLDDTGDRRVLLQEQVRARVVVFLIRFQKGTKMPLAKHNHVVKTLPPDRPDQPLRTSILPR